ncbi:MAG: hypothetical protein QOI11_1391 [Candidatus Eremiobacteraeota bacterium]|nr:hypothetical protein [Candidatus Eremiobacteraeota bacterium]
MSEATVEPRSGLLNVVDVVIAPSTAFARLRVVPTWGWAFLVAALLAIAGSLLTQPAVMHAIATGMPAQLAASPAIARLPAAQQAHVVQQQLAIFRFIAQFGWLFVPLWILLAGVVQALVMTVANAVAKGDGSFGKYFALSVTVAVVGLGLASLVTALIVMLRGTGSFDDMKAIQSAVPSLALLAPGAHGALRGFLEALSAFNLWATALLALGMTIVGRIPRTAAWTTAVLMLLVTALAAAYGASQQG